MQNVALKIKFIFSVLKRDGISSFLRKGIYFLKNHKGGGISNRVFIEKWFKGEEKNKNLCGKKKCKFIQNEHITFIIPGVKISGGVAVVLKHANLLKKNGYYVTILSQDGNTMVDWFPDQLVEIIPFNKWSEIKPIHTCIATSWTTAPFLSLVDASRKIYFVQSDERRFDIKDLRTMNIIEATYKMKCEFMTEALWIKDWLKKEFGKNAYYVPNGIDLKIFHKTIPIEPKGKKPRILIEGAINVPFKGMEDAYNAIKNLDCEIWIVSNDGKPKKDWRFDKFFEKVPFGKMNEIYSSCDIFLKMSKVEGFFGPPMEAMACGCAVVVGKVTGYDEYIEDGVNALVVEKGDVIGAKKAIQKIIDDKDLRKKLIKNGYETVKKWSWKQSNSFLKKVIV